MNYLRIFLYSLLACTSLQAQEKVETKTFSSIGTLFPQYTSSLSSRVTGRIQEVCVDVGDHVQKGTPLLYIDPLFFKIDISLLEAQLTSAKVDLQDTEINYQRMSKLWNKADGSTPSISRKRFEDAEVAFRQEQSHVQQAEESLKRARALLDETIIKAPFDGVITRRFVHPGESVAEDARQKLLEIESCSTMYVEFSIPQTLLSKIHLGTPISFYEEGLSKEEKKASITLISPHIDEKTRSVTCRAQVDNSKHDLHTGALVTVQVGVE